MKIKITVCLSIFLLLFSGAWVLQQKNIREFHVYKVESHKDAVPLKIQNTPLETPLNPQATKVKTNLYGPFTSREYVRIAGD